MKKSMLNKMLMMTFTMGVMYIPGIANAEEAAAPQEFTLDEVVVTANRMENKLIDTPANVAVVTAEEIERRNYQDAIEAIKNVPGVNVLGGAGGDEKQIRIGGDDRVLVLVDGRPIISDGGASSGRAKINASVLPNPVMIERIEVVKGGGSTVYGTDAVGGVINIITKSAKKNFTTIDVNTGSWGTQNYKGAVGVKEGRTSVIVTASKEKQNYIKYKEASSESNKKWMNSNSKKNSASIKVEQEIADDQLLTLFYDHNYSKGGAAGSALNPDEIGKRSLLNNNVSLKYDWGTNTENKGYVQVYKNHSNRKYSGGGRNGFYNAEESRVGVDVQQTLKTSDENTLVVGGSYYRTAIDVDGSATSYNKNLNNKALFVQDSWNFADTWTLNAGLRYDNHSNAGSKTTGSLAVNKKFNDNSHAYLSWSQIFNAPKTDDLYYDSSSAHGNPNLKPETGDIWTLGYETKIGRKSTVGASVFYSKLKDAINWVSDPVTWDMSVENVDKQKRRGFEVNYKYDFDDNWSTFINYTYVKVQSKFGDMDMLRDYNQMPNQYKFGVSYNNDKWNVDLYGNGASGGALTNIGQYGPAPAYRSSKYLTLDLSVNYKVKDNWKLYFKAYNLTNASYGDRAGFDTVTRNYSYPAAGRRFLVGTQITF